MGPTENDQQGVGAPMPMDGSGAEPAMPPAGGVVTPQAGVDPAAGAMPPAGGAADAFVAPEIKPEDVGLGDESPAMPDTSAMPAEPATPAAPTLPTESAPTVEPGEVNPPTDPGAGMPGATPQQ